MQRSLHVIVLSVLLFTPLTSFSASDKSEIATSLLLEAFGSRVGQRSYLYDAFLAHGLEDFDKEATSKIIQHAGSQADARRWVDIIKYARSKGLSDMAIGILAEQFGSNLISDDIIALYNELTAKGFKNGEAKARIIVAVGSGSKNAVIESAQLLVQFLEFIEDKNNLAAFLKFKQRHPSSYRRFVRSQTLRERSKILKMIAHSYGGTIPPPDYTSR